MTDAADLVIDHVQITVPRDAEAACLRFYGECLGLPRIPKPPRLAARGGAWYRAGTVELHVSTEEMTLDANAASRRHVCLRTDDLAAIKRRLRESGVEILPDDQPIPGWLRFYVRDPGGYRLEIAQRAPAP